MFYSKESSDVFIDSFYATGKRISFRGSSVVFIEYSPDSSEECVVKLTTGDMVTVPMSYNELIGILTGRGSDTGRDGS